MSVVAPSPFARSKRRLDENHDQPVFDRGSTPTSAKKARPHWAPSCPSRCVSFASEGGVYALSPSALAALLSLFPLMDEKVVTDVLSDCGNDINAAIKRLEELKLSSEAAAHAAAAATVAAVVQGHHHAAAQQPAGPVPHSSEIEPQQEPASAHTSGPQTGEQWVELLVQQMASARDMVDARAKGGAVLQQFEGFVTARAKADAEAKLNVLHKENGILKRAVQIQNTKLQEKAQQEQGQQHQLQQLQHMLAQYQEQVRTLQLSNYSLSLHLQKATSSNVVSTQRGPDVF